MATYLTSEPDKIFQEDVQTGASVSESVGAKIGSSINFVLDNFDKYHFGVTGATYQSLVLPYIFSNNIEAMITKSVVSDIFIHIGTTGTSGSTSFKLEKQLAAGGSWTTITNIDFRIGNGVVDDYSYYLSVGGAGDIDNPTITTTSFEQGDKLRLVLTQVSTFGANLNIKVIMRPVN